MSRIVYACSSHRDPGVIQYRSEWRILPHPHGRRVLADPGTDAWADPRPRARRGILMAWQRGVESLLSPIRLGGYVLPNRIVMAPMTRSRAGPGNIPLAMAATYYAQRATAGLILTEAAQIAPEAASCPGTPGIHDPSQVTAWRMVTRAVHAEGGRIFLQLFHAGRISHPSIQPRRRTSGRSYSHPT